MITFLRHPVLCALTSVMLAAVCLNVSLNYNGTGSNRVGNRNGNEIDSYLELLLEYGDSDIIPESEEEDENIPGLDKLKKLLFVYSFKPLFLYGPEINGFGPQSTGVMDMARDIPAPPPKP